MSTQSTQFTAFKISEKSSQTIDIRSTIKKYLYHWPLFVVGLTIAAGGFFVYLRFAKPVYEIKATLLIQDEKKTPNQQSPLQEIDLMSSSKLIENEIEIFKSKQLIDQVVSDLQLGINYKTNDELVSKDLYGKSPVKFTLLTATGDYKKATVDIIIKDKKSFLIRTPDEKTREYLFKDTFTNRFGTWKLEPTEQLEQYNGAVITITLFDPETLSLLYQNIISVNIPNKLSTAVLLSLDDEVPQRGKDILNRLIYNYNRASSLGKNRQTKNTLDFLDQRIDSLSGELMAVEKGIEEYKSTRGLTDISADSKMNLENMRANDTRLNEINVQLTVINGIERYINSAQNTAEAPTTFGITDLRLSGLIDKLTELQLQRARLLATTPESNPAFEPINRQIVITKAGIKENVKNIKESLQRTRNKLQSYDSGFKYSVKAVPTQEREFVSIKRQQAIKENLYTYLLQKREEVAVSYASTLTDDRIVDQAYSGMTKLPQKPIAMGLALLLGLTLPAALIFKRNYGKITNLHEIKDSIEIPVLGELPYDPAQVAIAIDKNIPTPISEQFRVLRTKLYHVFGEKKTGRVTLVTSSLPGEGKSFVSGNLSLALALSGRKTVILELDMRKPKIAEAFNIEQEHDGISDYLNGTAGLSDVLRNSGLDENLDVISSGSVIQNPSELLEGPRLKELLASLENIYDDVIIDSPPLRLVSDALILSRSADMTLFIIRQGVTEKAELGFIQDLDNQNLLSPMYIILNGIQSLKYGYGYNYNRSYYATKKSNGLDYIFGNFSERF